MAPKVSVFTGRCLGLQNRIFGGTPKTAEIGVVHADFGVHRRYMGCWTGIRGSFTEKDITNHFLLRLCLVAHRFRPAS